MDQKEYYKTLEKVLMHLQANPKATTDEVKALSGDYWGKVKEYLKETKAAGFILGGELWWVNAPRIEKCLAEVRIMLKEYANEKSDKRKDTIRQILIIVVAAAIVGIGSLVFNKSCQSDASTNTASDVTEEADNDEEKVLDNLQLQNDII